MCPNRNLLGTRAKKRCSPPSLRYKKPQLCQAAAPMSVTGTLVVNPPHTTSTLHLLEPDQPGTTWHDQW